MSWDGKKVLVTGADGFIGSHLVEALARAGAEVTALALYNSFGHTGWLEDVDDDVISAIEVIRGDIRDPHQSIAICRGQDVIFHLASLISVPFSYEATSHYIETNVLGTNNILQGALAANVSRMVHTSTSEVFGTAQTVPINEDHPLQAQSPYAASKIGADKIAESFHRTYDLPVTTLRPFNTYGPRQSERAVMASLIRQVTDDRCTEISIGDTSPRRDFMFVLDTVAAFLAVGAADLSVNGQSFNAGTGVMVSIGELLDTIIASSGSNLPVQRSEERTRPAGSEVFALQADSTKLSAATGWRAEVELSDGVIQTLDWWRSNISKARRSTGYVY